MGLSTRNAALFVLLVSGCFVDAEGNAPLLQRCAVDDECPAPQSPCEVGVCRSNFCYVEPAQDGPTLSQTVGDCAATFCRAGVVANDPDANDTVDDNPCTLDACTEAGPVHEPAPDTTPCDLNGLNGACLAGICVVACNDDSECPTADCLAPVCQDNKCKTAFDDMNVPLNPNPCTSLSCAAGVVLTTPLPAGPAVGCLGACDGTGTCLDCLVDDHCLNGFHCEMFECRSCSNRVMDDGETGVDCGDPVCGDCPGAPCTTPSNTCASGFCVDSVCCTTDMCGECQTCASGGTCTTVADDTPDESCTPPDVCIAGGCTDPTL